MRFAIDLRRISLLCWASWPTWFTHKLDVPFGWRSKQLLSVIFSEAVGLGSVAVKSYAQNVTSVKLHGNGRTVVGRPWGNLLSN